VRITRSILAGLAAAEALKPAGYICASIGKWHLRGPKYYPEHFTGQHQPSPSPEQ
jgi:arylsulfatase A-like enzyme